jgi:hypothetical protein
MADPDDQTPLPQQSRDSQLLYWTFPTHGMRNHRRKRYARRARGIPRLGQKPLPWAEWSKELLAKYVRFKIDR